VRDSHRIRERYELSLDNRQIVSFFLAGIVVIGAVFVLGVVVGKKLAGGQGGSNAADLLTALDAKAAAMDQAKAAPTVEPRLTFQEELTRKPSNAPSRDTVVIAEDAAAPSKAVSAEEPRSLPEPVKTEPVKSEPSRERLKQAIAKAEKAPPEQAPRGGAFTLQLSASQVREDAERFAAKLRAKGYQPYVVESDVRDRGRWYRVRMGEFASKEAAAKYLEDFRRETQLQAFVTSVN
jgi:cell division septation protein DedD